MGISQFATPERGFITRDFCFESETTPLPKEYLAWKPDAVVCHVASELEDLLSAIGEGGVPVVNTSRGIPIAGRGTVIADADTLFDAVHAHAVKLPGPLMQFALGDTPGGRGSQERYQRYTEERNLPFQSFLLKEEPKELFSPHRIEKLDEDLVSWLKALPKPVCLFSQQSFASALLCRACELLDISVPEDIAIIGVDGFDVAVQAKPSMTTVRLPAAEVGRTAVALVIEMLKGKPTPKEMVRVYGAEIIVRGSTIGKSTTGCDIGRAIEFIYDHACEGIRVEDVVSHTQGVSRVTFHKHFLASTDMTPAEAIKREKLKEARRLLVETKFSIGTITGMCGYKEDLYFSQVFRKAEGVSPTGFRKLHQRS